MERRLYTTSVCLTAALLTALHFFSVFAAESYNYLDATTDRYLCSDDAHSKATDGWCTVAVEVDAYPTTADDGNTAVFEQSTIETERFLAVFWNLENFYDYFDNGANSSDSEFSPRGKRHWTKKRFTDKCNAFGKTVLSIASKYGKLPDVIAVAEVENSFVLKRIADSDVLRKCGYSYVHFDSPDRRGIDVAMLYKTSSVDVVCSRPVHVYSEDGIIMRTRDILYSKILWQTTEKSEEGCKSGNADTLHIIVNHHPSKYSGSKSSAGSRIAAMKALKSLCDSTSAVSDAPIVMAGDFNDTAEGNQFSLLGDGYENLSFNRTKNGIGTIRFNGKWELIDHFIVSSEIADRSTMEIYEAPFLLEKDKTHTGWKPRRTYSGPRYIGGISDHLPIVLEVADPNPVLSTLH